MCLIGEVVSVLCKYWSNPEEMFFSLLREMYLNLPTLISLDSSSVILNLEPEYEGVHTFIEKSKKGCTLDTLNEQFGHLNGIQDYLGKWENITYKIFKASKIDW